MVSLKTIRDFLKENWFLVGVVGVVMAVPGRLAAVEKRSTSLESRQETIEKYIEEERQTKEMLKKAPPGWKWDEIQQKYVPDPTWKGTP